MFQPSCVQKTFNSVPWWSCPRIVRSLVALVAVSLAGCGEKTGTLPISGKVTYQNKPVANARVTFHSKSGARPADGLTDSAGRFQLGTFMAGDGALPGEYGVTINGSGTDVLKPPSVEINGAEAYTPPKEADLKSSIPAKYLLPEKSGLKAVVQADGPKTFDFDLKD